jgi:hypothetical protein
MSFVLALAMHVFHFLALYFNFQYNCTPLGNQNRVIFLMYIIKN